jgi:hypothetical protein
MARKEASQGKNPLKPLFIFYRIFLKKSITKREEVILLNTSSLETTDIFRGAFFICMGGDLADIRFRQNGGQIASFMFTGQDLHKHDKEYINGHAMVNPVQFREALNHLRDILFKQLREKGDMRYDRKRDHRAHQERR